ncbi:hypothetical protein [Desulfonema magnum]|uniref:hypothetical protein n=1 Tax=Desulfonema magnum TaxID=45655 RepID=UPI001A9C2550|nr:hypothetical protein [Desulfonema magnum]
MPNGVSNINNRSLSLSKRAIPPSTSSGGGYEVRVRTEKSLVEPVETGNPPFDKLRGRVRSTSTDRKIAR